LGFITCKLVIHTGGLFDFRRINTSRLKKLSRGLECARWSFHLLDKEKIMKKIILGQKVRDKVTGFVGIATCRSMFLSGCDRIGVQPFAKEGKVPDSHYFDEPLLEIIDKTPITKKPKEKKKRGGPQRMPVDNRDPR
jgi:hypothetical protein